MIGPRSYQPSRLSANSDDYDALFIARVHRLIKLGYDRLDPREATRDEETAITGDLVEAVIEVLDCPSEEWMRFYNAHDDPPENEPKRGRRPRRRGRRRRRIDIRLDSSETSPRTRFRFECKRLGRGHGAERYLGPEGLGCFLRGEYAAKDARAGMLGYVQCDDEATWAARLEKFLLNGVTTYSLLPGTGWRHEPVIAELSHTYRSSHRRGPNAEPFEVYHTLLRFC